MVAPVVVKADPNVHTPPPVVTPHVIADASETPFVVMVLPDVVARKAIAPVYERVMPVEDRVMLP